MTRKNGLELTSGIVTLVLAALAMVMFFLSYTTGYYIYGQMNSAMITALLGTGIAVEIAALIPTGMRISGERDTDAPGSGGNTVVGTSEAAVLTEGGT